MSTYYEEKVVDPPVGDPLPFKLNYSPRAYELPGQPISVDKSGTVTARQGNIPRAPRIVTAITEAAKPVSVSVGVIPEAPASVSVLRGTDQPASVSVESSPKQPSSVASISDPIKPASVSAAILPNAPASVSVGALPEAPASVDILSNPKAPAVIDAFVPFVVEILETEAEILARSGDTPPGTVAFGTDTKNLYVFNERGLDAWGSFEEDN